MRTIAIVLGDNDFAMTFLNLLETLKRVLAWHNLTPDPAWAIQGRPEPTVSRENIELIIRQMVIPHYLAFQYSFRESDYGVDSTQEAHLAHLATYLGKARILFDEEAEAHIAKGWNNGESWYLELQSGNIGSN